MTMRLPSPAAFLASVAILAPLASSPAFAQGTVDSRGTDVTVLRSFRTNLVVGTTRTSGASVALDLDACPLVRDEGSHELIDCGEELSRSLAKVAGHMNYPLAKRPVVFAEKGRDGRGRYSSYYCTLQEIQTVTPESALEGLAGIGFWFDGAEVFVRKEHLATVDQVRLADGRPARVHAFLAPIYCWQGSATSSSRATYAFKPFAQFDGADSRVHRVWDLADGNYVLSYSGVNGFDRRGELLAP